jgi:hypothetical protein
MGLCGTREAGASCAVRRPPAPARLSPGTAPGSRYLDDIARSRSLIALVDRVRPEDIVRSTIPQGRDPLVTVIVPMFNAIPFVERCLKSLLMQTHRALEIVCVDDHSEDDTFPLTVERFGADRRVNVVPLGQNVGPYQIKNWVISRVARAELIAMQDVDDVSHPRRLERQLAALEAVPADVCGVSVHQFFPADLVPFFGDPRLVGPDEANLMHSIAAYGSLGPVRGSMALDQALGPPRNSSPSTAPRCFAVAPCSSSEGSTVGPASAPTPT